jgi:HlyD family secretion protein
VRLNPTIQQNVVTYNVVVAADNRDGQLMPGMTAHVLIPMNERRNVLRVANAALTFRPKSGEGAGPATAAAPAGPRDGATVQVLEGGKLRPVRVRTGITDNTLTEVTEGDLKPGDQVVTRELTPKQEGSASGFRIRVM